jgi:hypothetical protein
VPVGDRVGPPARLGDGHGQQFGECGFVVDDQHTHTVATGPLAAGAVSTSVLATGAVPTDVLATVTLAAHAGAVAEDALTGDAVVTGTIATDGLAGGARGAETFASGARHMTILSRFAGRTLCSDFVAAVRKVEREPLIGANATARLAEPPVKAFNSLGRRGHWHGPATGIP